MIIALLSDIHSNREALRACLEHAAASGVGRYAFLGDLVGYGADPQWVVDTIARYAADGAIVIKGNHDEAVEKTPRYMNESVRATIDWTRERLSASARQFLFTLPLCTYEDEMCFVHASALHPQRWNYVDSPAAAQRSIEASQRVFTFSGHIHDQELYFRNVPGTPATAARTTRFHPIAGSPVPTSRNRRWLALVGSVGQPRDRNPAAAYTQFDTQRDRMTFHRIPYDRFTAARKIRDAGLPESIAYRVEHGI